MSSREGETLRFLHQSTTTGAIIATKGVFSTKAETGTTAVRRNNALRSLVAFPNRRLPIQSNTPVARKPADAANNAPIRMTALLAKPASACSVSITPVIVTITRPPRKSRSTDTERRHCITTNTAIVVPKAIHPWRVS